MPRPMLGALSIRLGYRIWFMLHGLTRKSYWWLGPTWEVGHAAWRRHAKWRRSHTWAAWPRAWLHVRTLLTFCDVRVGYRVDDRLSAVVADFWRRLSVLLIQYDGAARTLIVINDISQVILSRIMCFPNAHRVMCEVDITVIA